MKCVGDVWCKLNAVNLDHRHFDGMEGVYLIWHGGSRASVVYVGQGVIRERLRAHKSDERIQAYSEWDLYVTWAKVDKAQWDGIENYLADLWRPKVADRHPVATPIEVSSPW